MYWNHDKKVRWEHMERVIIFCFLFLVSMTNGFDWSMVIGVWVRIFRLSIENPSFIIPKLTDYLLFDTSITMCMFIEF